MDANQTFSLPIQAINAWRGIEAEMRQLQLEAQACDERALPFINAAAEKRAELARRKAAHDAAKAEAERLAPGSTV